MKKKALFVLLLAFVVALGYSDPIDWILDPAETGLTPKIAAPVHCSVRCTELDDGERILYTAGDNLRLCFQTGGSLCGGYTHCGKSGEDCIRCCSDYCSKRGINEYLTSLTSSPDLLTIQSVIAQCEGSCRRACSQNANIYSIRELIIYSAIIIAAVILVFCGFKFILSTSPYSRDNARKCIIMVVVALVILGLAIPAVDLFYKPTEEEPKIEPYIDVLKAECDYIGMGMYNLNLTYRSGWLKEGGELEGVKLEIIYLDKGKSYGVDSVGNMGAGEIRKHTESAFYKECLNFRANFSSKEGSWAYDFICDKDLSNKCRIVKMRVERPDDGSGSTPTPPTPSVDCSTYTNLEECEAGGVCWWDDAQMTCKGCLAQETRVDECNDYPTEVWGLINPGGICPVCIRNPCSNVDNGPCHAGVSGAFGAVRCMSCENVLNDIDECKEYQTESSCECDPCKVCGTDECVCDWGLGAEEKHITINLPNTYGTVTSGKLYLACGETYVAGTVEATTEQTIQFRVSMADMQKLIDAGCGYSETRNIL